ncbi:MAG: hypothetical protein RQ990_00850 [Candidatus Hydrothermia bacterium]|jgi:hypothetical protein|nr:hypothetical protein [Candidatus Hydrothermia bacterium]
MVITLALFSFVKTIYFSNDVIGTKIIIYQNNYYVFGNVLSNAFVIKLNQFKTAIWSKVIYNVNISDAVIYKDTIFLFTNFPFFSIIKMDKDGNLSTSITYSSNESFDKIFFSDAFGNLYLTSGNIILKINHLGRIMFSKSLSNVDYCNGTNDFYLLCRYNFQDLAIIKIDINGNILKSKSFGLYNSTFPIKLFRINGKFYVFSQYSDISNKYFIFIASLDTSLNQVLWSKIYKPVDNINLYVSSVELIDNKFIIAGNHFNDIFFISIDTLGNLLFSRKSKSLALEQNPKIFNNTILFYNQDSLSIFDFNVNDGSSCILDTILPLIIYNISTKPFQNISINSSDYEYSILDYPISEIDISVYENSYCKVSVSEKQSVNNFRNFYSLNGAVSNCNLKNFKIYLSKGKKILKVK